MRNSHSEVAGFEKFTNSNKKRESNGKRQMNKANKTVRGNKVMFAEHYM